METTQPGKRFLLADDEAYLTTLVQQAFQKRGHIAVVARNGNQAFDAAVRERPDLIITDFQMPMCSGLELATKLRETPTTQHIPVIMLTGRGHRITPTELSKTNIRWVMAKPFSMRELLAKVDEVLESEPQRDAAAA